MSHVVISGKSYELTLANLDTIVDAKNLERQEQREHQAKLHSANVTKELLRMRNLVEEQRVRMHENAQKRAQEIVARAEARQENQRAGAITLAREILRLKDPRNIAHMKRPEFADDDSEWIIYRTDLLVQLEKEGKSVEDI